MGPDKGIPFKNSPAVISPFFHCFCVVTRFHRYIFFFPQQLEGARRLQFFFQHFREDDFEMGRKLFKLQTRLFFFFLFALNKGCPKLARGTARCNGFNEVLRRNWVKQS